jgi:hypothetical protein
VAYALISQKAAIRREFKDIMQQASKSCSATDPVGFVSNSAWEFLLGKFTALLKGSKYCALESPTPELDRFALSKSTVQAIGAATYSAPESLEDPDSLISNLANAESLLFVPDDNELHERPLGFPIAEGSGFTSAEADHHVNENRGDLAFNSTTSHQEPNQDRISKTGDLTPLLPLIDFGNHDANSTKPFSSISHSGGTYQNQDIPVSNVGVSIDNRKFT